MAFCLAWICLKLDKNLLGAGTVRSVRSPKWTAAASGLAGELPRALTLCQGAHRMVAVYMEPEWDHVAVHRATGVTWSLSGTTSDLRVNTCERAQRF